MWFSRFPISLNAYFVLFEPFYLSLTHFSCVSRVICPNFSKKAFTKHMSLPLFILYSPSFSPRFPEYLIHFFFTITVYSLSTLFTTFTFVYRKWKNTWRWNRITNLPESNVKYTSFSWTIFAEIWNIRISLYFQSPIHFRFKFQRTFTMQYVSLQGTRWNSVEQLPHLPTDSFSMLRWHHFKHAVRIWQNC